MITSADVLTGKQLTQLMHDLVGVAERHAGDVDEMKARLVMQSMLHLLLLMLGQLGFDQDERARVIAILADANAAGQYDTSDD